MEWNLDFISKEDYRKHVKQFFTQILDCTKPNSLKIFNKNIIDPIKMTFSYFAMGENKTSLINSEATRQQDKTINNSIGYFHQNMFSYIEGWMVPEMGFDIINQEKHIFVEIKNKHNTMNSSSSQKTYINMQSKILDDDKATCMLVEVIAKQSQDIPWTISVNGERKRHNKIRKVSIDKFYEIVTNDRDAFKKLVEWLPITLKDLAIEIGTDKTENKIIEELEKEGAFFTGLYDLAFGNYVGFKDLRFQELTRLNEDFK